MDRWGFTPHSHLKTRRPYLRSPETSRVGPRTEGRGLLRSLAGLAATPFILNFPAPSPSLMD